MPSFDTVSTVDNHELTNAIDQSNREIQIRFDFKGVDASFTLSGEEITIVAPTEFQVNQMIDILKSKLSKRNIDIRALDYQEPIVQTHQTRQAITVQNGIDAEHAKKIVKHIKDQKMKVQSAIQGDRVRVTAKKRDDLQAVMALLRAYELGLPLQFENFRD